MKCRKDRIILLVGDIWLVEHQTSLQPQLGKKLLSHRNVPVKLIYYINEAVDAKYVCIVASVQLCLKLTARVQNEALFLTCITPRLQLLLLLTLCSILALWFLDCSTQQSEQAAPTATLILQSELW